MSSPLQRVRDLLRLAADDGATDAEARNAALLAARLIHKHSMTVQADDPTGHRQPATQYSPYGSEWNAPFWDKPGRQPPPRPQPEPMVCERCGESIQDHEPHVSFRGTARYHEACAYAPTQEG